jgi:hypothetical protein
MIRFHYRYKQIYGFSVFWLRFISQFWLILHLLDTNPRSECGSRKPIECGFGSGTLVNIQFWIRIRNL